MKKNLNHKKIEFDFLSIYAQLAFLFFIISIILHKFYYISIFIGVINIYLFIFYKIRINSLKDWTECIGIYNKYYLQKVYIQNLGRNLAERYRPYCRYSYIVEEKKYFNDTLGAINDDFAYPIEGKDIAEKVVFKTKTDKNVRIYYNPNNPHESVLTLTMSQKKILTIYTLLVLGILSFFIGMYNFYLMIRCI